MLQVLVKDLYHTNTYRYLRHKVKPKIHKTQLLPTWSCKNILTEPCPLDLESFTQCCFFFWRAGNKYFMTNTNKYSTSLHLDFYTNKLCTSIHIDSNLNKRCTSLHIYLNSNKHCTSIHIYSNSNKHFIPIIIDSNCSKHCISFHIDSNSTNHCRSLHID